MSRTRLMVFVLCVMVAFGAVAPHPVSTHAQGCQITHTEYIDGTSAIVVEASQIGILVQGAFAALLDPWWSLAGRFQPLSAENGTAYYLTGCNSANEAISVFIETIMKPERLALKYKVAEQVVSTDWSEQYPHQIKPEDSNLWCGSRLIDGKWSEYTAGQYVNAKPSGSDYVVAFGPDQTDNSIGLIEYSGRATSSFVTEAMGFGDGRWTIEDFYKDVVFYRIVGDDEFSFVEILEPDPVHFVQPIILLPSVQR